MIPYLVKKQENNYLFLYLNNGNIDFYSIPFEFVSNQNDNLLIVKNELSNYPNPFNPTTTISFNLPPKINNAKLDIFNLKSQKIFSRKLTTTEIEQGKSVWNANKNASGVYFYEIKADNGLRLCNKMVLIK